MMEDITGTPSSTINDATESAEQRAAIITKLADHMRRYGER